MRWLRTYGNCVSARQNNRKEKASLEMRSTGRACRSEHVIVEDQDDNYRVDQHAHKNHTVDEKFFRR